MKVDYQEAETLYRNGATFLELSDRYNVSLGGLSQGFRKRGILSRRAQIELKTPSPEKLAYYAGLFDGEGHITIALSKTRKVQFYWLQIGIANTFLSLMDDLKHDFGIGHLSETYGAANVYNKRRCQHWRCTNNQAMHVLKCLLPYLRVKKDQAILAIEFQERLSSRTDTSNAWKVPYKERLLELKQAIC